MDDNLNIDFGEFRNMREGCATVLNDQMMYFGGLQNEISSRKVRVLDEYICL